MIQEIYGTKGYPKGAVLNHRGEVTKTRDIVEKTEIGPAKIGSCQSGSVVSKAHFNKIQFLIKRDVDKRAKLIAGGLGRSDGMNRGQFVGPTNFADVTQAMAIWKEEIFGPVLCIPHFDGEEEAIVLANDLLMARPIAFRSLTGCVPVESRGGCVSGLSRHSRDGAVGC